MELIAVKRLEFSGYDGRRIVAEYQDRHSSSDVFIFFSGMAYGRNHPLHYFLKNFLSENGIDSVFFDFEWSNATAIFEGTEEQAIQRVKDELLAAIALLKDIPCRRLHLVGKSLGTLGLEIFNEKGSSFGNIASYFWLTPFINTPNLVNLNPTPSTSHHFYVGTQDSYYQKKIYDHLKGWASVHEFEGLDHSLEIAGDVKGSLNQLSDVFAIISRDIQQVLR
jgi:hypothetical protein